VTSARLAHKKILLDEIFAPGVLRVCNDSRTAEAILSTAANHVESLIESSSWEVVTCRLHHANDQS
jgi:hypothetical protein